MYLCMYIYLLLFLPSKLCLLRGEREEEEEDDEDVDDDDDEEEEEEEEGTV